MSEAVGFRIQRADGQWYAGRGADRFPTWTTEEGEAYRFERLEVSQGVVAWLAHHGYESRVVDPA